jgi:2-hydroxy-6-oxonona-2,4-dienedioate hydrolase
MNSPAVLEQDRSIVERAAAAAMVVAGIERRSLRISVPTVDGPVVWRAWGEGKPVVLVHGGAGSWTHWIRNIEVLARRRRVIALDLPGCGESQFAIPLDDPGTIALRVRETLAAVVGEARGLDFVAFSFGGIVSSHLAAPDPNMVGSLNLVGAVGLGVTRPKRTRLQPLKQTMDIIERWDNARKNLEAIMIADPQRVDDLAIYLQDQNALRTRLRSSAISRTNPLVGLLGRLQCPVRAVWGRRDNLYPQDIHERVELFARLQHPSEPMFIDPGGHWIQFEQADAFNRWIVTLLDQAKAPS